MALEKTKLTKEKIIDIVTNDYGLLGIIQINYINRGTSNIFQVIVNDKKYILKEFHSERTIEYIEKEINIINFLSIKGISVPKYIQLKNGEYYTKYQDRIIIMQEFIEGEVLEDNSANYEQLIKSAKLLGKLIKTLEKYPDLDDEDIINQKFSKRYLLDAIEKIKIEKNKINTDNKYKEIFIKDYETKIAIAHNMNDNAETVLLNLIRGTGMYGLEGIQPIEYNKFIKPLINCQRKEIEEYCQKQQLNPRIDSTNKENTYTRNKIRNLIIPELTKINPNIIKTLQRTTEIIKEENSYIEKQVQIKYKELAHISKKCIEFSLKEIRIEDKAVQKRLINKAISGLLNSTNNISKINIDDIIKMIERNIGNKTIKINKKIEILIKNKKIFINLVH